MELTSVIIKPYQTEKTYAMQSISLPKYSFVVNEKANKYDIALAFFTIYGKKPLHISTQLKKPVSIKNGTAHPGYTKLTKIAYITLSADDAKTLNPNKDEKDTKVNKKEVVKNDNVAKKEVKVESDKHVVKSVASKKEITPIIKDEKINDIKQEEKVIETVKKEEKNVDKLNGLDIKKVKPIVIKEKDIDVEQVETKEKEEVKQDEKVVKQAKGKNNEAKADNLDIKKVKPIKAEVPTSESEFRSKRVFNQLVIPLPPLAQILGVDSDKPIPRADATKLIWEYIRKHDLQDKKEKRNIHVDELMHNIIPQDKEVVTMFELPKYTSKFLKTDVKIIEKGDDVKVVAIKPEKEDNK